MSTIGQQNGITEDVIQTFGQTAAQPMNEHPTQRDQVMEFRRGNFRVSVDMNSFWDRSKEEYGPYAISISVSNNRKYSSIPADEKTIAEFADWLKGVAEVVKGAPKREGDRTDTNIEAAKRVVAKYKKA